MPRKHLILKIRQEIPKNVLNATDQYNFPKANCKLLIFWYTWSAINKHRNIY